MPRLSYMLRCMGTSSQLYSRLHSLDGKSYSALKQLAGTWQFQGFDLHIDKVQPDPYASASRIRITLPVTATEVPQEFLQDTADRVAVSDFIARDIYDAISHGPREFQAVRPGQEILPRSSVTCEKGTVQVALTFQFPAAGRRVKGRLAAGLLVDDLPGLVSYSALGERLQHHALKQHVQTLRDYLFIQRELQDRHLVGFVADGAVLARRSGNSDTPLANAVPFESPAENKVFFDLPSGRSISGLGIREGITLLVGGGFHGKSTLLKALERGVFPHIPGDGRQLVVSDPTAVSVRAEDGRAVTGTNISTMINNLPGRIDTQEFSTANASGSTSQAANLAEAVEIGTRTVLIDEDTSATNFMIRDQRMKALISAEPITPFVDRISDLWEDRGISTILVMGGSGAFFEHAHTVIALNEYVPQDVTERAHQLAKQYHETKHSLSEGNTDKTSSLALLGAPRTVDPNSLLVEDTRKPPRGRGLEEIQIGKENLDLRYLSQLVDSGQTQAIALCLPLVARRLQTAQIPLAPAVQEVIEQIEREGLETLTGSDSRVRGDVVLPRKEELFQAISRWRKLRLKR